MTIPHNIRARSIVLLHTGIVAAVLTVWCFASRGEGPHVASGGESSLPDVVLKGTAGEFESWIKSAAPWTTATRQQCLLAERALKARLAAERYTSDAAICAAVSGWSGLGGRLAADHKAGQTGVRNYAEAVRFLGELDKLLQQIDGRASLRGSMLLMKGELLNADGLHDEAHQANLDALEILGPLRLKTDTMVIVASVKVADRLNVKKEREKALRHYAVALRYPWYIVEDVRTCDVLRDCYRRSVRGVMEIRRKNPEQLRWLRRTLIPAGGADLREEIDRMLGELGQRNTGDRQSPPSTEAAKGSSGDS